MMDWITDVLGLDSKELVPYQMAARAVVMYIVSIVLIRLSGLRLLGKQTPFDHLTVLILGAMLGRAIVAGQSFGGSILAAIIIIGLHRLCAWWSFTSKKAGSVLKGEPVELVKNSNFIETNLTKTQVTKNDLEEAARTQINTSELSEIKDAFLERSGKISIVKKKDASQQ